MTDRELLELAAKAIGVKAVCGRACGGIEGRLRHHMGAGLLCMNDLYWNPLADDGDALRLSVKLGVKVLPYPVFSAEKHSVIASRRQIAPPDDDENTYVGPAVLEPYGEDPYAATRRAIVLAAAEIGRSK